MIRFCLRFSGFVLMAAAFAALVVDGSRSIAGGRPLFYSLGDAIGWLEGARGGAVALGAAAGWPAPARAVAAGILAAPGWIAAAAVGLLLLYAGRRPPSGDGFSRRRT